MSYLFIKVPRRERVLHNRQEGVSLHPSDEQLLSRKISLFMVQVVAVATDHVGEHKRVPVQVHLEGGRNYGGKPVVETPDRVAIYHADVDGEVLGPGNVMFKYD